MREVMRGDEGGDEEVMREVMRGDEGGDEEVMREVMREVMKEAMRR